MKRYRAYTCVVAIALTLSCHFNVGLSLETWIRPKIWLAGLFPMEKGYVGSGVLPAVNLAIGHVNYDDDILPHYDLDIAWNDTECDMAVGTKIFFDMMHDLPEKVMLFGDACSHVTVPIALSSKWWNVWQLSYADTDPTLSVRENYPNFFRTVPSDSDFNFARMQLLRHFKWERVGTVFQDASKGSIRYAYAHSRLTELLDDAKILRQTESFSSDPKPALTNLKQKDIRIIMGNFDANMAQVVFCAAYEQKMYGPKYLWIIPGDFPKNWWKKRPPCDPAHLQEALQGHFGADVLTLSSEPIKTVSGLTPYEYEEKYNAVRGTEYSKYHGYAYDGIWAIAKTIDQIIRNNNGVFQPRDFRNEQVPLVLNETNFYGVTGKVLFNNGDRIGGMVINQLQGDMMVEIGEYDAHSDSLKLAENHILWNGKGPPKDRTARELQLYRVNITIYAALCAVSGLGIVVALIFLAINIKFRRHRYIKMSSPNMNNLIMCGCVLTYTSVFLLGTDGKMIPENDFYIMCSTRMWILCVGYTLSFGAMFSKTWRVHAIFTNIKLNKKVIKDYKLFLIVAVMLLIDVIILSTWQFIDPLLRESKLMPPEIDPTGGDVEIIPYLEYCRSEHMTIWTSVIYVYKGLLLIFGCFLAWETRHVSIPALNDSKYIGMSVYNVVITCVAAVPISFIIKDRPDASYLIISLLILFCTTITLCLVFVPKLIELRRDPKGDEKRIRATLRKSAKRDESGTDMPQKIRHLAEENYRYRQILEEKKREIQELLVELGEDGLLMGGGNRSPAHRTLATLKGENNIHVHNHHYKTNPDAPGSDDECSLLSTSSATNLWPMDTNLRHYTHVTRNPKSAATSDVIELREISRPLGDDCLILDPTPDVEEPLINRGHSSYPTVTFDDVYKDRSNRSSTSTVRTPSYQGLKFLNDIFSLKETAILSDSEPDQSEAGSTHSLPDAMGALGPGGYNPGVRVSGNAHARSYDNVMDRAQSSRDLGDWRSMPKRERLLGDRRRNMENVAKMGTEPIRPTRDQLATHIPRNGRLRHLHSRHSSTSPLLRRGLSQCDVIQYI